MQSPLVLQNVFHITATRIQIFMALHNTIFNRTRGLCHFFSGRKPTTRSHRKSTGRAKHNLMLRWTLRRTNRQRKKYKFFLNNLFIYRIVFRGLFKWIELVMVCRRINHDKSDNALQNNSNSDPRQPRQTLHLSFACSGDWNFGGCECDVVWQVLQHYDLLTCFSGIRLATLTAHLSSLKK